MSNTRSPCCAKPVQAIKAQIHGLLVHAELLRQQEVAFALARANSKRFIESRRGVDASVPPPALPSIDFDAPVLQKTDEQRRDESEARHTAAGKIASAVAAVGERLRACADGELDLSQTNLNMVDVSVNPQWPNVPEDRADANRARTKTAHMHGEEVWR